MVSKAGRDRVTQPEMRGDRYDRELVMPKQEDNKTDEEEY